MQERPSASVTLMDCGIVSEYSPPCSIVSKRRPVPFMLGSWGRFSGVISSNLWVSFIRRLSSVSIARNVCLSALNQPPNVAAVQCPLPASSSVTRWRPRGNGIGSSNGRFQPRLAAGFDRLAQPLHREFDILRLQVPPALDLGLVPIFRKALEIFHGQLFGGRALPGEFLADERVLGHRVIKKRPQHGGELRPLGLLGCANRAGIGTHSQW